MPYGAKIPILMFTAETDVATKMAGVEAGVDDYLTKPTDPTELIDRVASLLQHVPEPEPTPEEKQPVSERNRARKDELPVPPEGEESGKLIALCGVRGGVGTTTTAINLACMLALTKHPTTLVDFDLKQGHVGLYLNQKITYGVNQISNVSTGRLRQELRQHRVAFRHNLHLLMTQPNMNGRYPIPNATEINSLLDNLIKPGQHVVADLGLIGNETIQPVIDRADHLIICLSPERISLAAAKQCLNDIKPFLFSHTKLHLLVCDMRLGASLPQQSMEKYLKHRLLGIVPLRYKELVLASNKGLPLIQAFPKSSTMAALYKISLQLAPIKK